MATIVPTAGILSVTDLWNIVDGVNVSTVSDDWIDTAGIPYLSFEVYGVVTTNLGRFVDPVQLQLQLWGKNNPETDIDGTNNVDGLHRGPSTYGTSGAFFPVGGFFPANVVTTQMYVTNFPLPRYVRLQPVLSPWGLIPSAVAGTIRVHVFGWCNGLV